MNYHGTDVALVLHLVDGEVIISNDTDIETYYGPTSVSLVSHGIVGKTQVHVMGKAQVYFVRLGGWDNYLAGVDIWSSGVATSKTSLPSQSGPSEEENYNSNIPIPALLGLPIYLMYRKRK